MVVACPKEERQPYRLHLTDLRMEGNGGLPAAPRRSGSKKDRPRSQAGGGIVQFLNAAEALGTNSGGVYMGHQQEFLQPPVWDSLAPPPPPPPAPPPPYEDFPCGSGSIMNVVDPYGMPQREHNPMIAQVHEVRLRQCMSH